MTNRVQVGGCGTAALAPAHSAFRLLLEKGGGWAAIGTDRARTASAAITLVLIVHSVVRTAAEMVPPETHLRVLIALLATGTASGSSEPTASGECWSPSQD